MEKSIVSLKRESKLALSVFIIASAFSFVFLSSSTEATEYSSINSDCMVFVNKTNLDDLMNAEWLPCYEGMPESAPRVGSMAKSHLSNVKSDRKIIRTGYEEGKIQSADSNKNVYKYGAIYKDDEIGYRIGYRNAITKENKQKESHNKKESSKDKREVEDNKKKDQGRNSVTYIYVQRPSVVYYPIEYSASYLKTRTKPHVVYVTPKNQVMNLVSYVSTSRGVVFQTTPVKYSKNVVSTTTKNDTKYKKPTRIAKTTTTTTERTTTERTVQTITTYRK